jgi:hypothetical protein
MTKNNFPLFLGGGITPFFNWLGGFEMGVEPYIHFGFMSSRMYRTRFYAAVRIGQNVLPVTTLEYVPTGEIDFMGDPITESVKHKDYPTVAGLQFGIAW